MTLQTTQAEPLRRSTDERRATGETVDAISSQQLSGARVSSGDLILFTTQLAVMLDSGVVLSDALDAIAAQADNVTLEAVLLGISEDVKSGTDFSRALSVYPHIFNSMFVSMVRASEASGRMVEMLNVLSGYLNFEAETRKRIKGALTYPFVMALMAVAATGTLMFFVLPRFMKIYAARGADLPRITQVIVGVSTALRSPQIMAISVTVAIAGGVAFYYAARTPKGRRWIDTAKIRTPVLGGMFKDVVITRSMRIIATMVNTGVQLLDAIRVVKGSCDNYCFQQLWSQVDDKIRDGYQLSDSILIAEDADLIAPGIVQMLRAGERNGKLGEVCDKISVFYEQKLQGSIHSVMTLIEPLMITVLGGIIGTIAIALLLPIFRISTVITR